MQFIQARLLVLKIKGYLLCSHLWQIELFTVKVKYQLFRKLSYQVEQLLLLIFSNCIKWGEKKSCCGYQAAAA